jgi:uncharacterized lipoprotein YmbA
MKKLSFILLILFLFSIAGCSFSQPSRFYRLSPSSPEDIQALPPTSQNKTVSVGPVTIPVVLNRPQIATLSGKNAVIISEYNRWAGSLNDNLVRTLTDNLSTFLPSMTVVPFELGRRIDFSYQLVVDIQQFDGTLGKSITLKAGWIIIENNTKKPLIVKLSSINMDVQGNGYEDYVAAMSATLGNFSLEIAQAISSLK